ncbi:MAG: UvrD-helicase domain-containing protein [Gammaproteobacteria bacterium]
MKLLADQPQREQALDPHISFIVQAPAGSGKTELLVQRYLVLLANAQQAPEEIVAITFTRKAAAEMRDRVLQALQKAADIAPATAAHATKTQQLAQLVLQRDQTLNWNLLQNPNRLRINTIDALCLGLVRQMPLLAKLGTQPKVLLDAKECYRQAVQTLLNNFSGQESYAQSLEILLSHLDNHYANTEKLLMDMLAHRDQWLPHLLHASNTNTLRDILQQGLANIILERIQNCAQFFPEHLKPIFLMLVRFAASQLPEEHPLVVCRELNEFPPLTVAEQARWCALAEFLLTKEHRLRKQVTKKEGFPADKNSNYQSMKHAMLDLLAELQQNQYQDFFQALQELCEAPPAVYTQTQWQVVNALVELLPVLAAQLQLVFQEQGGMDFVGIASAAIQALGESDAPTQLALHLDYQIRHLLVDEFQDTSLTQFRLLELLTAGWQENDGRTLFLVGDPMQSIYRFRQAEVGLFLRARHQGIGSVPVQSLVLSVNFRSNPHLIDWINNTFSDIFPKTENIAHGAIRYTACEAAKPSVSDDGVFIYSSMTNTAEQEAAQILKIITDRHEKYPQESIGILVRSRSHLQAIIPALQCSGVNFQAVEIEKLHNRPIIDDLLALTRALFHLADRTAWLAILRAPWCGLTLSDLHILANQQPTQPLWQTISRYQEFVNLSQDAQQRLQRVVPILQLALLERGRKDTRQWVEGTWWALGGPACLLDAADLHYARIYFALLEEWVNTRHVADLSLLNDKLTTQYATPSQTTTAQIQLMTVHKAKGLEFDSVILPGLDHRQRQEENKLLMWLERPRQAGDSDLVLAPIHSIIENDPIYDFLRNEQQKKDHYELARLLYVAATRARKTLHLLGNVELVNQSLNELKPPTTGSFLSLLWPRVKQEFNRELTIPQPCSISVVDKPLMPTLHRLKVDWNFPISASLGETLISRPCVFNTVFTTKSSDIAARLIGKVVHQMLHKMSQEDLRLWDKNKLAAHRKFWQKSLLAQGMPSAKLEGALETINIALTRTLQDQRGRWLLDYRHRDAKSEYSLTTVLNNKIVHLVIDRTFVTADGTRWIVDYKTAVPNNDVVAFLDDQQHQCQAQLQGYACAMQLWDMQRPIRLGLYFPLCSQWREWPAEIVSPSFITC